jgi:hypothetical protein
MIGMLLALGLFAALALVLRVEYKAQSEWDALERRRVQREAGRRIAERIR